MLDFLKKKKVFHFKELIKINYRLDKGHNQRAQPSQGTGYRGKSTLSKLQEIFHKRFASLINKQVH